MTKVLYSSDSECFLIFSVQRINALVHQQLHVIMMNAKYRLLVIQRYGVVNKCKGRSLSFVFPAISPDSISSWSNSTLHWSHLKISSVWVSLRANFWDRVSSAARKINRSIVSLVLRPTELLKLDTDEELGGTAAQTNYSQIEWNIFKLGQQ